MEEKCITQQVLTSHLLILKSQRMLTINQHILSEPDWQVFQLRFTWSGMAK